VRDYRLPRQAPGTRIALAKSPLGPDLLGVRMGTIVGTRGNLVFVDWDDEEEGKMYASDELKYKLDRGLLRLTPPPKPRRVRLPKDQIECKQCGHKGKKRCGCPRPGAVKPEHWGRGLIARQVPTPEHDGTSSFSETLTGKSALGKMTPSSKPTDRKDDDMADEKQGTLSPKDLAARASTDAKAFRRFLRSDHSGIEDAGQGNRYAFTEEQAESLLARYETWAKGKGERKSSGEGTKKRSKGKKGDDVEAIDFESAKRRAAAEATEDDGLEEIDLDDLDLDLDEDEPEDTSRREAIERTVEDDDDEELEEL